MVEADNFGAFFRKTRQGLGVKLRAFCYQNGFDAGNVSRIERSLTPPPKKDEGLEKYAKALKLRKGSTAYERFFDLAAAETGQISGELLAGKAEKLPRLLKHLRSGSGHRNWVTARHLNQWAETLAARSTLPQLVRRLAHATGKSITFVTFPAHEQTQRTGLDGAIDAAEVDAFVPLGRSVWEMGVSNKPAAKAEADFVKRRTEKLGFDKKTATYIFVTPQSWPGKENWVGAKNKLKVWKEVKVYDSANLEEWLELAPAVDVWLARQIEVRPDGLSDIDEYWDNLSSMTEPALKPSVFLASRKKQAERLEEWLAGPPGVVALETRSPAEAVDFVAAVMRQTKTREVLTARTVLVREKNAWRSIARSGSRLVLVAHPDLALDEDAVAEAVRQGHHVILPVAQATADRVLTLSLPRVYRHHLDEALRESGMERSLASDYAGKAGGSLTVLKRLLGKVRGSAVPQWCSGSDGAALVPMLLAGGWVEQAAGDQEALSRLAGQPYEAVGATATRWLDTPDPPLKRILSTWELVSRDDSWFLLSHAVSPAHLKKFEQVALAVLGENDPALDLPPDKRWMANVEGKVLRHSQSLREGVAETLALLGARAHRMQSTVDAKGVAAQIVRQLLEPKDWKRWASLSRVLPLLAEAAPDAFLKVVDDDLRSQKPVLPQLFEQDGRSTIFSSAPHAGLLWALEGLAWNREELARVSYSLARLDELLGGKKTGNSPITSLTEIFLPWFPQTTAPVEERTAILRRVCRRTPETGWRLLLDLLPDQVRHASEIRRPVFRDWALTWSERRTTTAEWSRQVRACSELAVEFAGEGVTRLKDLIERFENLDELSGEELLRKLGTRNVSGTDREGRRELSEALRVKVARHRRCKEAEWALPEEVLVRLEQVQKHLEPTDAVAKNAWLFNSIWEVIAHDGKTGEEAVVESRRRAIEEVRTESGWDGILALAGVIKAPTELGFAVGKIGSPDDDARVLPTLLQSEQSHLVEFARGYVSGRFSVSEWGWAEKLSTEAWAPASVVKAAHLFPVAPRTWAFVETRGQEALGEYWLTTERPVSEPTPEIVRDAVRKLIEHGRPSQASFVIGMARHMKCETGPELAAEVFEAGLTKALAETERDGLGFRRHYVTELIESLQKEAKKTPPGIDPGRVATIEWAYLGLLDGHPATPVLLHEMLATDPESFVTLLTEIFSASDDDGDDAEKPPVTDESRERASSALRLLMSWKRIPGTREDRSVDGEELLEWTCRARSLAEEKKRLAVCDSRLGEVLAYAPMEPDEGGWPCVSVRDLIEEVASTELERGFEIGIHNKRGVYTKSLEEGGSQERGLAARFQAWADLCKVEWPRTAAALRRVAEGYQREAERADAETELRLT